MGEAPEERLRIRALSDAPMAESQRKAPAAPAVGEDDEQSRKEQMFRIFFFLGMIGVVIVMVLLAKFLSGQ